jgi:hypothetical protein
MPTLAQTRNVSDQSQVILFFILAKVWVVSLPSGWELAALGMLCVQVATGTLLHDVQNLMIAFTCSVAVQQFFPPPAPAIPQPDVWSFMREGDPVETKRCCCRFPFIFLIMTAAIAHTMI